MADGDDIDVCRFCGAVRDNLDAFYDDFPGFIICAACVRHYRRVRKNYIARERVRKARASAQQHSDKAECSFCGKLRSEVGVLIVGPDVNVCDECVDVLGELIAEHQEDAQDR